MLTKRCMEKPWIEEQARRLNARDPRLVETCIFALEFVGRLAAVGLDFVFKGGTSLLLHVRPPRRLSIDVDIATPVDMAELQRVFKEVCNSPFGEFEYQDWRDRENPPARHFKIPYESPTLGKPWPLQLDVLLGDITYPVVENKAIDIDLIEPETPQSVRIPSIDCLLGDKLTAFAPETVGVLYKPLPRNPGGKTPDPKPIRVLKQLFDVGELFPLATDLGAVSTTYDRLFDIQNQARGGGFTRESALDDTIDAAYWTSQLEIRRQEHNEKTTFLRSGIQSLDSHVIGPVFDVPSARIPASRAALMAALLRSGRLDTALNDLRIMPEPTQLLELPLDGRFVRLVTLRKLSPEAFYYWHLASTML